MKGKLDPEERVLPQELPPYYQQTSDEPYDRHHYRFHLTNGESIIFKNYQEVQAKWFQTPDLFKSHIEILDKKTNKSKGGFK